MKRCILITGATNGTGFAIAERFAKEGYDIFIGSRTEENAKIAAASIAKKYDVNTRGYGMIVYDEKNVKMIFDDIHSNGYLLDVLVLNAANLGIGQVALEVSIKKFMEIIETNVGWNFMLARAAALQMKEKGHGAIVFINSNTAYRAIPDRVSYSTSKSGILGMARALALDWGKYGIRVNCVLPGMIKTDRFEKNLNGCQNAPSRYTPIGDIAEFEDIANAAYFLGSDQSRNTTGAEITVDGGNMIQLYPIIPSKK